MYKYTFNNGDVVTSNLPKDELIKRMDRLGTLIALTEQHESPIGRSICKKAVQALHKSLNFTGVIRLTSLEKEWLSYMLESDMISDKSRQVINFYISCR